MFKIFQKINTTMRWWISPVPMAGNETDVYEFFTHIWSASFTTLWIFGWSACPTRWRIFLHLRLPGWVIIMPGLGWAPEGIDSRFECLWILTTMTLCVFRTHFLSDQSMSLTSTKIGTQRLVWSLCVNVSLPRFWHSASTACPAASRIAFDTPMGEKYEINDWWLWHDYCVDLFLCQYWC